MKQFITISIFLILALKISQAQVNLTPFQPTGWDDKIVLSTVTGIHTLKIVIDANANFTETNESDNDYTRTKTIWSCEVPSQPGAITGSTSVCRGSSQTYSISDVPGATSYTWTLPSDWSGSSNSASIIATAGASGGTISVVANNSCGSGIPRTLSVSVTAIPAQPGAISGATTLCTAYSDTYSISPVSGATSYTWTEINLDSKFTVVTTTSSPSKTVTVAWPGITLSVTANNSCGSSTPSKIVISGVRLGGPPAPISGPTSVCQGSSYTYSTSGFTSFSWGIPSGWSGSSTSNSITVTVGASSGTIGVQGINECGPGLPSTLNVTVTATPSQPGAITGSTSVCRGSSQTYSISDVPGATSYTWTLPSDWSGSSNSASIIATAGASGGTISVVANNSCGSGIPRTLSVSVTAIPAQPGAISGATTLCTAYSDTYSISPVSGATSYTWTEINLDSKFTVVTTTSSPSKTVTVAWPGITLSVTANNSCGSSTPSKIVISGVRLGGPPAPISGPTSVCQGSSYTYSTSGFTSFSWGIPSGWSGSSTSNSITVTVGASSGTIGVQGINECGPGLPSTLNVTVTATPSQPGAITGSTSVCRGSSQTYSISDVPGATSYTWTLPSDWSGSSNSASIIATAGASGGTISVVANNSCGSGIPHTLSVSVTAIPAQPGAISGATTLCTAYSDTYSISPVSGATSYTWTEINLDSKFTVVTTTSSPSKTVTVAWPGITLSVTANNSCGSSTPSKIVISGVRLGGPPAPISGPTSVCQGSSYTYSTSGFTSFSWGIPSGWSGSSTSNSITVTVGASSGTIGVQGINECGPGLPSTLNVTVTATPSQPGAITGSTSVCRGSSQTYSISDVPGATSYTWTLPSDWSGSSNSASIIATAGASGGTISIVANNSCGSSLPSTLNIVLASKPTVTTAIVSGTTTSTATGGGNITSNGGEDITERGVCWSISVNPTIYDSKSSDGTSNGSFTSIITDLTNGVTYHIRAFATNCSGTGYGSDISYFNNTTGIVDIQPDEISIYPNPVSDILNIEYKNDNYKTINIISSQGVLLEKEEVNSPRQQLDFSKYEYGFYILEFVKPSGEKMRVKIINH